MSSISLFLIFSNVQMWCFYCHAATQVTATSTATLHLQKEHAAEIELKCEQLFLKMEI